MKSGRGRRSAWRKVDGGREVTADTNPNRV